jgi:hypothetical protein
MKNAAFDFGAQVSASLGDIETKEKGYRPHSEVLSIPNIFKQNSESTDWLGRKQTALAPQFAFATIRTTQLEYMPEVYALQVAGLVSVDDLSQTRPTQYQAQYQVITPLFIETATIINASLSMPILLSKKEGIRGDSKAANLLSSDKYLRKLLQKKSSEKIKSWRTTSFSPVHVRFSWTIPFEGAVIPRRDKALVVIRSLPDIWPIPRDTYASYKIWKYEIQRVSIEILTLISKILQNFDEQQTWDEITASRFWIEEYLEIMNKL